MLSKIELMLKEYYNLMELGNKIYAFLYFTYIPKSSINTTNIKKDETIKDINLEYERWYTKSVNLIKVLLPERLNDFKKFYYQENRKSINHSNYTMTDFMMGIPLLSSSFAVFADDLSQVVNTYKSQLNILASVEECFESNLFEIKQILQSNVFGDELDAAIELNKNGFARAAGAMAGVVLERHLLSVLLKYPEIKLLKKDHSINGYNAILLNNKIINSSQKINIDYLSSIRNKCTHPKNDEPKSAEVSDLIEGVAKVIKTIL